MSGIPSTMAWLKVAKQSAVATAATTGFITGMMEQSGLNPRFDPIRKNPEHGAGTGTARATANKTPTRRGSYVANGVFRSALYPDAIGLWLLGAGFAVTSTGSAPEYTHVFKLTDRSSLHWLTVLWQLDNVVRRATDCRVNKLTINANTEGVKYNGSFLGMKMDAAAGTETGTDETIEEILPNTGSLTLDVGATHVLTSTDLLNGITLDIANNLTEDDRAMFNFRRADLPQKSIAITGKIEGVPVDWSDYKLIQNGGTTSNDPSATTAVGALTYTVATPYDITGGTNPYSLTVQMDNVELSIDDVVAESDNLIKFNLGFTMLDKSTDPIVITLVNGHASY